MAGQGFLPTGTAINRNKPRIPTTNLPAAGCQLPIPDPPATYELGAAGRDWWDWAWRTSQACGWDNGQLFTVAARAQLEDDKAAMEQADEFDWSALLCDENTGRAVKDLVTRLRSLAQGRLSLVKECRELDTRLGLTPKGLADLRWKIVEEEGEKQGAPTPTGSGRRRALKVVPDAAAG